MNLINTLRAIDIDLDYLAHYNTPGSHWYVNGPGKRFQAHAQYAMGKANPDAKERKSAIGRAVDKIRTSKARFDAKQDAAITAMRKGGVNTLGAERIGMQRAGADIVGSIAGGMAAGLGARGLLLSNRGRVGVRQIGMVGGALKSKVTGSALLPNMIVGGERFARGANMLVPSIASYMGASLGGAAGAKAFDAIVARGYAKRGQGSLKDRKVSDAYAKAYKDTYKKYLKEYSKKRAVVLQPSYEFNNAVNKSLKKESNRKAGKSSDLIPLNSKKNRDFAKADYEKAKTVNKLSDLSIANKLDSTDWGYMVGRGMGWTPPKKYRKER